eukprot:CAMPEP_0194370290 /NCGR_PEP_ID=MMETSP0174-20130528/18563_1 /TAXON_ID=216777 /ORGANISM="Proboscia alata, Strain PI-D3" /LENGTH=429 /DNA_ID=CAMNT_0039147635 /DNA_START=14 /DNA_END=1303 /DNA_ORIENTATION=+
MNVSRRRNETTQQLDIPFQNRDQDEKLPLLKKTPFCGNDYGQRSPWRKYAPLLTILFILISGNHISTSLLPSTPISNPIQISPDIPEIFSHHSTTNKASSFKIVYIPRPKDNHYTPIVTVGRGRNQFDDKRKRRRDKNKKIHRNSRDSNRNIQQNIHDNMKKPLPCKLRVSPQPVILMSLGRSGSGSTWQIMGNLSGEETPSDEYTGSSTKKSAAFFRKLSKQNDQNWMLETMCERQKLYPNAGMVGFKWKPFESIFSTPAKNGLQLAASSRKPGMKVVRLRRNLLDVVISRTKHKDKIQAHCAKGDEKCIQKHLEAGTGIELNTDKLLALLRSYKKQEDAVDELLVELGVPAVHISFEKAYYGTNANEWIRVCDFLEICTKKKKLTMTGIHAIMGHEGTSNPYHNVTLKNYVAVKEVLHDTEFEALLH